MKQKKNDPFMSGLMASLVKLEEENLRVGREIKAAAKECESTNIEEMIDENPKFKSLLLEQRDLVQRIVKVNLDTAEYLNKHGEHPFE